MLRDVCDRCGKIIDGEPNINKEQPDAVLVIDDEVILMFDSLCPKCKRNLKENMLRKDAPAEYAPPSIAEEPQHKEPEPPSPVVSEQPGQDVEERPESAQNAPQRLENLPNQVTKQFPIKLKPHSKQSASSPSAG